jgi:hypothetical protein
MTIAELNEYLRKTIPIFTASGNMHGRLTFNNINTAYNTGAIVLGITPVGSIRKTKA